MPALIVICFSALLMLFSGSLYATPADSCYKLDIQKKGASSYALVTLAGSGKKLVEVKLPEEEVLGGGAPAELVDFNFDGYPDLSVFNMAGNVQVMYDVYLFDPSQQKFVLNRKLSEMPCVEADPAKKLVLSNCNHSSACENWSETYRWSEDQLVLESREGTKCSPKPGCYFEYSERLQGAKLRTVSNKLKCD